LLDKYAAAYGSGSVSLSCHYGITLYAAFVEWVGKVEIPRGKGTSFFREYILEAGMHISQR